MGTYYKEKQINGTFQKARRGKTDIRGKNSCILKTNLPYIHGTTDKIAKILREI